MEIKARIDKMLPEDSAKTKAFASVTLDGEFVVHGVRIIEGKNGLFAAMPSYGFKDSAGSIQYGETFHAISKEGRHLLNDAVFTAYEYALHRREEDSQKTEEPEELAGEQKGQAISM